MLDDFIRQEIEKEFDSLSFDDHYTPKTLRYAFDAFGYSHQGRTFGLMIKSGGTIFNMRREHAVIEVIQRLINLDDYKEIISDLKMSEVTLVKIIELFMAECKSRGVECPLDMDVIAPKGLGKASVIRGYRRPNVKLNIDKVTKIKSMLQEGISFKKIGDAFGVSASAVYLIKAGLTWKD